MRRKIVPFDVGDGQTVLMITAVCVFVFVFLSVFLFVFVSVCPL